MDELLEIINVSNDFINIDGINIKFKIIAQSNDLDFTYGLSLDGWIIIKDNSKKLIHWESDDFRDFLFFFEIDYEDFESSFFSIEICFEKIFPIEKISYMIFKSQSNYWGELLTSFLIKNGFTKCEMMFVKNLNIEKWMSQKLKQNLLKIHKIYPHTHPNPKVR